MNAYEAYVMFLALKRHFTTKDYSYFKYAGKVRTSVAAFEKRNDRYFFDRLARFEDPKGFVLAALTREDPQKLFIGSLIRDNKFGAIYKEYRSTIDALEYTVEQQISTLHGDDFKVRFGQHPRVVDLYYRREISLETLAVLHREVKILDYWNKNIRDTLIWPDLAMKIEKYSPFLRYDRPRIRAALAEVTK